VIVRLLFLILIAALFAMFAHAFWYIIIHYATLPPSLSSGFVIITIFSIILAITLYYLIRGFEIRKLSTSLCIVVAILMILYAIILYVIR